VATAQCDTATPWSTCWPESSISTRQPDAVTTHSKQRRTKFVTQQNQNTSLLLGPSIARLSKRSLYRPLL
jgi:hypothetical protein